MVVGEMKRRPPNRSNPLAETQAAALAEVRAVYAELARRPVERQCTLLTQCCQFRITGATPYLTKGEALMAARGVRVAGRKALPERTDGACPFCNRLDTMRHGVWLCPKGDDARSTTDAG